MRDGGAERAVVAAEPIADRSVRDGGTERAVIGKRRARDSRALPVEGGADGCKARALSV